jgi:ubiquitin carboxyl-terminal hydrolase L5
MSSGDDWCTIESDPGVFTELLEELGCKTVQLEELWTLDDDSLKALQDSGDIYGLIFLFQYGQAAAAAATTNNGAVPKECLGEDQIPEGLFFAHQVTTNACATQAILSVVLNTCKENVALGSTLTEFRDFTASFPPSLKGVAISSSEPIKTAHNAFGRTDAFLNDGKHISPTRESEDVFHFVAYIPKDNKVYELDGLQSGPIVVGTTTTPVEDANNSSNSSWLSVARAAIQERMQGDAIKFNLMAVIQDKRIGLQAKITENADDSNLAYQLQMEEAKRTQWRLENQRRQHNYVPLCVSLLKELARAGKLPKLVEEAKERKRQKREAAKK